MTGIRASIKYAYSSTRVKAMESNLLKKDAYERMLAAKEPGSIAAMLLQTDYKPEIEKLGGAKTMDTLIDFALSRNLGRETSKLISIAPKDQRDIVTSIAGVWDVNNLKLTLEAVGSGRSFDDVSKYVIDTRYVGPNVVNAAMGAKSVEGAIEKLIAATPYSSILRQALDVYRKTHSTTEANNAIEIGYYSQLGSTIDRVMKLDKEAAALIRKRIDMRNVLTLLQAKRYGSDFAKVSPHLLPNGTVSPKSLERMFKNAKDVQALAEGVKVFNLRQALASYNESKNKPLLLFEISMLNDVFTGALKGVRHSMLSFGTIVAFLYLKEIEVFTLRILVKGKSYGLSDAEIKGMISWLK